MPLLELSVCLPMLYRRRRRQMHFCILCDLGWRL
jgi:hypothetical protein